MYTIEEYDKQKSRVLKYVLYKKRSKQEVKNKFYNDIEENMLEDIICELEENGYINDTNYIERAVNEFIALNNLSIKEIKYKLIAKGIPNSLLEDYINDKITQIQGICLDFNNSQIIDIDEEQCKQVEEIYCESNNKLYQLSIKKFNNRDYGKILYEDIRNSFLVIKKDNVLER